MRIKPKHITVFEHESLLWTDKNNEFDEEIFESLCNHHAKKCSYFSLIHKGVKFNSFVGVLQVGKSVIEILPKADKNGDKDLWRNNLIGMLQVVGLFNVQAPTNSALLLKQNSILDLYFELFIREIEYLLKRGLVKKYRKTEGNCKALKGSLHFGKHIQKNIVHQERFYVNYTTYDKEHQIHSILYKAIKLLMRINTNANLISRLGALTLDFPEMPDTNISEASFSKLVYDRKTEPYKSAIGIARLLLLNYHPNLSRGADDVLALVFDMNQLWEKFVFVSLQKYSKKGTSVTAQTSINFWKSDTSSSRMRPDIVINKGKPNCVVLDTKWKNIKSSKPSIDDLRQLYVYSQFYNAPKVALVYPGSETKAHKGQYCNHKADTIKNRECSIISLAVMDNIRDWQASIAREIEVMFMI